FLNSMSRFFSDKLNLLVTGGMDRLVRMWNPHVPGRPTGILKGHCAPIVYLCISSDDGRIFSVSADNAARVRKQLGCCLFTAHPKASMLRGDMAACLYSSAMKGLYVVTDSLGLLSLITKATVQDLSIRSHKEAVLCCGYSQAFRQVVSCTESSVIKVWDVDTGAQVFEYGGAHGQTAVTCMTFDPKGRRLVTGGRDGCLKIWNFNNGHCLKILSRGLFAFDLPQPSWQDDLRKGHKDDILCIAQCPPCLLATSSYDGEIIVWNLGSGHIQCRFLTPLPPQTDESTPFKVSSTLKDVKERKDSPRALSQEVSGLSFLLLQSRFQQEITKLAVTQDDCLLFAADHIGYVYVYDIKDCGLTLEQKLPKSKSRAIFVQAHSNTAGNLQLIESHQVLVTCSTDCTVRLWSINGEFIGTFGQPERWILHIASSWRHPAVPYEVLTDPLSMPSHSILDDRLTLSDALRSARSEDSSTEVPSTEDTMVSRC
uniref:WD40 repeat domain 95 n=1 Tax=Electrophorus electricus TaxID=8005 RepID=A0A4W4H8A3_ELEEL